jgi:monovalent cation:H+ antiporter-2, CPA2 family
MYHGAPASEPDDGTIADPATSDQPMTGGLGLTLLAALAAALMLGAVAHRLRMAPMVGYIAAGLLVGPFTPGFVANREEVLALADIGVALLMFSIGLRFSLRELRSVGALVLAGAPLQVAVAMAAGTGIGLSFGWDLMQALFIGAALAISSSVVLAKVAGEAALATTAHGRIALGWSIVQDLLTVVLAVVLTALTSGSQAPLVDALRSSGVALGFVLVMVLLGSRVLPSLLGRVARLGSRELFVIAVAVLAIGTAFAASSLGVSVALGAFVAGLALADSDLTASVLGEIVPLRELFATIFFVSIGILLQPAAVLAGWPVVVALLALVILGKLLPVTAISLLARQNPSTAARAGTLLAQSGEFSFVLATLGLQVGAVSSEAFSLAMGAVVLSIVTAAPLNALIGRLGGRLDAAGALRRSMPGEVELAGLRRHAVVLGYGQVGRSICRVLATRGFGWVAVDADYGRVRSAREAGSPVIFGDAGAPSVLEQARVSEASVLVVAISDALATLQAVEYAVRQNPRLAVVARAHSSAEEADLRRAGALHVVVAQRELGNELVRHALRRFGVSDREVAAILRRE